MNRTVPSLIPQKTQKSNLFSKGKQLLKISSKFFWTIVIMRLPVWHKQPAQQRKREVVDVLRLGAPKCTVSAFRMESYAQSFVLVCNAVMIAKIKYRPLEDILQKLTLKQEAVHAKKLAVRRSIVNVLQKERNVPNSVSARTVRIVILLSSSTPSWKWFNKDDLLNEHDLIK